MKRPTPQIEITDGMRDAAENEIVEQSRKVDY